MCKKLSKSDVLSPKAGHIYPVCLAQAQSQALQLQSVCHELVWIERVINLHHLVVWGKAKASPLAKRKCINKYVEKLANLRCCGIRKPAPPSKASTSSVPKPSQSLAPLSLHCDTCDSTSENSDHKWYPQRMYREMPTRNQSACKKAGGVASANNDVAQ
jgi:hypothetical protein